MSVWCVYGCRLIWFSATWYWDIYEALWIITLIKKLSLVLICTKQIQYDECDPYGHTMATSYLNFILYFPSISKTKQAKPRYVHVEKQNLFTDIQYRTCTTKFIFNGINICVSSSMLFRIVCALLILWMYNMYFITARSIQKNINKLQR